MAGQKVSRPSAARARTGIQLTSAVAHEWQSVLTVDGAGRPSPFHLQSLVPVSQIRRAGPVRLGSRPGSSPFGRSERQGAVRCMCRDRDPADQCRRPRAAVSPDRRWGRTLKPVPFSVPSPRQSDQACCHGRILRRAPLGRSERQWAVRRDWDPAGWCRRPQVAVSTTLSPQSQSVGPDVPVPLDSGHGRPFQVLPSFIGRGAGTDATFRLATAARLGIYFAEGISKKKKQSKPFQE